MTKSKKLTLIISAIIILLIAVFCLWLFWFKPMQEEKASIQAQAVAMENLKIEAEKAEELRVSLLTPATSTTAPATLSGEVGSAIDMNLRIIPTNATDKTFTVTSSDEKIVKASNTGVLALVSEGVCSVIIKGTDFEQVVSVTVTAKAKVGGTETTAPAPAPAKLAPTPTPAKPTPTPTPAPAPAKPNTGFPNGMTEEEYWADMFAGEAFEGQSPDVSFVINNYYQYDTQPAGYYSELASAMQRDDEAWGDVALSPLFNRLFQDLINQTMLDYGVQFTEDFSEIMKDANVLAHTKSSEYKWVNRSDEAFNRCRDRLIDDDFIVNYANANWLHLKGKGDPIFN